MIDQNLILLQAAVQGFRDAWDALSAMHVNLGITGDTDEHEQKRDALEDSVEELAGWIDESAAISVKQMLVTLAVVHTSPEAHDEQQPA